MIVQRLSEDLFPEARNPEDTCAINERCLLRTRDGHRVVLVSGVVWAQYAVADRMAEAHAMVNLVACGWADQSEVARAFGLHDPHGPPAPAPVR